MASCATTYDVDPRIAPAATDFASAPRVEVRLDSFSFEPRTLGLQDGQPVTLAFTNVSDGGHNFAAPGFFQAAQVAQSSAPIVANGAIEVGAGDTVEIQLIPSRGGYDVDCTHTGHTLLGMTGSIVVR
ncbi:copper-binding protein [Aurantiacibacter aquimixticola]|uniref:Copper-binding protein n=2 Tax=Aurantiacibacter aquimixticola TaxID=1958945 RepID=A0A419RSW6_9SPHN|nr:copper-binding protein [Aurantiacibacter aquimixticola]